MDAQQDGRLRQPCGNLARPGPGLARPGSSQHGTVPAARGWLWEGKAEPEQGPFIAAKAASANRSKASLVQEPEGASSFRLAEPCALGTIPSPGTQAVSLLLFPLSISFIIFLEFSQLMHGAGGMAMGGMRLPRWEETLPEHGGETEAGKGSVLGS